jgi:hypothetical protein
MIIWRDDWKNWLYYVVVVDSVIDSDGGHPMEPSSLRTNPIKRIDPRGSKDAESELNFRRSAAICLLDQIFYSILTSVFCL